MAGKPGMLSEETKQKLRDRMTKMNKERGVRKDGAGSKQSKTGSGSPLGVPPPGTSNAGGVAGGADAGAAAKETGNQGAASTAASEQASAGAGNGATAGQASGVGASQTTGQAFKKGSKPQLQINREALKASIPGFAKMSVNTADNIAQGISSINGFPFKWSFEPVTDEEAKGFAEAAGPAIEEILPKIITDHPVATIVTAFGLLLAGKFKAERKAQIYGRPTQAVSGPGSGRQL